MRKERNSSNTIKKLSKNQSYQFNQTDWGAAGKSIAYLKCSYLDRGTLDVRLVRDTMVFCSALRVTSLPPPSAVYVGWERAFASLWGGECNISVSGASWLSGAFYLLVQGGPNSTVEFQFLKRTNHRFFNV